MIASVLKTQFKTVVVFNKGGRQMPDWQGEYDKVKTKILLEAPPEAEFFHERTDGKVVPVPKEIW